ncbi:MAG: response regulator [Candidatus Lernaella stagnicola]|nr:response regulator [Candidatus Lernaella stagnicola]
MRPKTILLIEPDRHEREELVGVLQKIGYDVDGAGDSTEGLRMFTERRHDLVVVEVLIPGVNGLQVCKIAKEQGETWDVKVIVVSKVYQSRAMEHDAINRYHANAYFSRPFPVVKLLDAIAGLIGKPTAADRIVPPPPPKSPPPKSPPPREPQPEKPAKPPAPEPPAPEPRLPDPLLEEGELSPEILGGILVKFRDDNESCLLEVKSEDQAKHIFFRDGKPVFVKSNIPEETLGRMLVNDRVINEEQYKDAMVEMAETGKRFGTVVAAMGLISSDDLYYHLVQQTRLKIGRCFAWPRGSYRIDRDTQYPEEATTFESEPFAVVLDGYRDHIDTAPLESWYEQHKAHFLFFGSQEAVAEARQHLTPPERQVVASADGKMTLGDAVGDSTLGLMSALRLIRALDLLGVVRLAAVAKDPELEAYASQPPPTPEPPEVDPRQENRVRRLKSFFVQMDDLDDFALLGVAREASADEIHRAFLEQQKEFHPDTFTLAAPKRVRKMSVTVSRRLQRAYHNLRDPETRRRYSDRLEREAASSKQAPQRPAGGEAAEESPVDKKKQAMLDYQDGMIALEQRRYAAAVDALKKAAAGDPKNIEYRAKLAEAMFKLLEDPGVTWDDVESVAKRVLASDTKRVDMLRLVGQVKAKVGDDEKALSYFKKALELDPHNPDLKRDVHYTQQRLKKSGDKNWSLFGKKS